MPCCSREFYKFKVSDDAGDVTNKETKGNQIWTGFKEQTTAHGVPHVHQARGIFKTLFWSVISLACFGMLMYNLYYISKLFFSYKVDVVVALQHQRELTFPSVTICNMNPVKESYLNYSTDLYNLLGPASTSTDSYYTEEKAYEILASLDDVTKQDMGYNIAEFIIDCQYAGSDCHMDDYRNFFDPNYGNCYIFNSAWDANTTLVTSKRAGRRHGMKFVLNVKQDEYVESLAQGAGARILIHSQSRMPFPSDEGILATPGQITSIGIRQMFISRKGGRFGNCTEVFNNATRNVYEEIYPVNYTSTACYKTCYQRYVISRCGCADPQYPRVGTAFGSTTAIRICDVDSSIDTLCKGNVSLEYQNNDLECDCPTQCIETAYSFEVSNVEWPSEVHESVVLSKYAAKFPDVASANDTSTKLRKNVIKVEVYFQEFNYETMTEREAYHPAGYASDIGGILGLWLGLSVLSIFEFFELGIDLLVFLCYKCRRKCSSEKKLSDLNNRNNKTSSGSPPPPYSSNESLRNGMANSRNTVSTGLQDNVQTDGSLRYV